MKVAVIGSRGLQVDDLENYLPPDTTEIVSGGAKGIDTCARDYALAHGLKLTEFLPDYRRYGRHVAPLKRNETIVDYADLAVIFWDSASKGTAFTIRRCQEKNKPVRIYIRNGNDTYLPQN
ncbi:MAG: DUF2493 domain-containing protein [Clostridia bacterium]|nr:DUF2493 domain-containing protein [Clostridia bacterium]